MSTDSPTYINQATDTSPFSEFRELVLGRSGGGMTLQSIVLGCWNGSDFPADLSRLTNLDDKYRKAAIAMIEHYAKHGENDRVFMALADEIIEARRANEAALAAEREEHS